MKVREEKGRRRGRTLDSYRYEEPRGRTMVSSGLKKKKIGRERARERATSATSIKERETKKGDIFDTGPWVTD